MIMDVLFMPIEQSMTHYVKVTAEFYEAIKNENEFEVRRKIEGADEGDFVAFKIVDSEGKLVRWVGRLYRIVKIKDGILSLILW